MSCKHFACQGDKADPCHSAYGPSSVAHVNNYCSSSENTCINCGGRYSDRGQLFQGTVDTIILIVECLQQSRPYLSEVVHRRGSSQIQRLIVPGAGEGRWTGLQWTAVILFSVSFYRGNCTELTGLPSMRSIIHSFMPACLPTYLPTYIHPCIHTCILTKRHTHKYMLGGEQAGRQASRQAASQTDRQLARAR